MNPEITPERLDALLDGAEPQTDAEREMLHLAARMKQDAPRGSDALRERVMGLETSVGTTKPKRRPWWRPASAKGRWLVAGPALSVLLVAVIGTGVLLNSPGDGDPSNGAAAGGAERDSSIQERAETGADQSAAAEPPAASSAPSGGGSATTPSLPADRDQFSTIPALLANSTEVVVGRVGEGGPQTDLANGLIRVERPFTVTRVVRGSLAINQTVGIDQTLSSDGSPALMEDMMFALTPGGEYLLFLKRFSNAPFYSLRFEEGTWEIVNGRISVLGSSILSDNALVQGRTVEEAIAVIETVG